MIIKAGVHHGLAKPSAKNPQNKFYQFPDKYKFLKVVGQGAFGKVLRCLERDTNSLVAIKIPSFENSCRQEVAMLRWLMRLKLDKHNIVKFHECFSVRHGEALVFESLEVTLYDHLYYNHVTLADSRTIIKQIATALKALKNIGVIHTDIKLDNIMLVDKKPPLRAKLIDFGLAMDNSTARQGKKLQTVGFRAPEIILGMPFSEAIDMWSVGCVLFSMLNRRDLFHCEEYYTLQFMIELLGQPPDELLNYAVYKHKFFIETKSNSWRFQTIEEYGVELLPQAPNKLGFSSLDDLKMIKRVIPAKAAEYKQCIKLMKAMLTMDQNKRITPNEVLQHPFITHLNNEDTEDNKDTQDNKDTEDTQDTQDNEDNEDTQDNKDTEDNEDTRDNKDTEDTQDNMDTQDIEDTQDNMDTQDIEDTQDNMIIKAGVHHGLAKPSAKNPQNKFYQFPDKYEFLKVVGQGGFGKVLRCLERDTDSLVAIKIPSFENSCRQEVACLEG
nr:homeodomain-interacting protein kinase 3-like [Labrus bergylta]